MQPSPLIRFALDGLTECYVPEQGLWSFRRHLDGREQPNELRPAYDVYYSLNVLLGFSKIPKPLREAYGVDAVPMFHDIAARMEQAGVPLYAYGMALWTAAELGVAAPPALVARVRALTAAPDAFDNWTAQAVGLMLSGAVAQARTDATWLELAERARRHILDSLSGGARLFRDRATGPRRLFASFATQVYCTLGLYHYAEACGDAEGGAAADDCVTRLIELQGPRGEWPWFYYVPTGRVADFYEVYSVHQHGMAPAILHHAVKRGVPGARAALVKGFMWIFGENELGVSMLRPDLSLIARSQARRDWSASRVGRLARALTSVVAGFSAHLKEGGGVMVRQEVRSYEFGWILWSFGDDVEFPELTQHEAFRRVNTAMLKKLVGAESVKPFVTSYNRRRFVSPGTR